MNGTRTVKWLDGPVELTDYEFLVYETLAVRLLGLPKGEERSVLANEIDTFLRLKAVFPGSEYVELEAAAETEAGSLMRKMAEAGWRIPGSVLRQAQAGQLRIEDAAPRAVPPLASPVLSDPGEASQGKRHAGAHATELAASFAVMPRTGTQRRLILDGLGYAGEQGLLDEEIAVLPGVADTAHRTRRNELVLGGWVVDSGRTGRTASGADSIVWVLTAAGRERWEGMRKSA